MTLTDDVASQVDSLLAALAVDTGSRTPPSPIDPGLLGQFAAVAPTVPRRSGARPVYVGPAPNSRHAQSRNGSYSPPDLVHDREYTRPSSPTNTESTSGYPATPAESIRESFLLPPQSYPLFDSRSSSTSSSRDSHVPYGHMTLPSLPEEGSLLNRFRAVNGSMSSQHSLNSLRSHSPDRKDKAERVLDRSALVDRVHPDRVKQSTLESAGLFPRNPPPSSLHAQTLAHEHSRDFAGGSQSYLTPQKHNSVTSSSTAAETASILTTRSGGSYGSGEMSEKKQKKADKKA